MIIIQIKFTTGKYYAKQWGNSNKNIPEWPPSPYRFFRAMLSSWKYNLPELNETQIFSIIKKLSSMPPKFHIPYASYMYADSKKNNSIISDIFIRINKNDPVNMIWPNLNLNLEEESILKQISYNIHYLGKTKSWCNVQIKKTKNVINCIPFNETVKIQNSENQKILKVLLPKQDITMDDLYTINNNIRKKESEYPNGSYMVNYIMKNDQTSQTSTE